jgi:hypothetical protein
VSKVSLWQKGAVVARVGGQLASRNRVVRAVAGALRTTGRSFGRALHQLWLEVTGFVFLGMAGLGGVAGAHEYAKYQAGRSGAGRVVVAVWFCFTFAYFGLSSFWRVRRKKT